MRKEIEDFLDDDDDDNLQLDLSHAEELQPTVEEVSPIVEETSSPSLYDEQGFTMPFDQVDDVQHGVATALIHKIARRDSALARDIAYFGQSDLNYILTSYALTNEELTAKLSDPRFANMVEKYAQEIGTDNEGLMKFRARAYLETIGLSRLQTVIANPNTKDENLIKAVTLMSQLGGAMPKGEGNGGGGANIVFNFGNNNPIMKKRVTIDHE